MVEKADLEKNRNEMDVVCRIEQKILITFKPASQLNSEFTSKSARRMAIGVDSADLEYFYVVYRTTLGH